MEPLEGSYIKDYKREMCSCGAKMIIRPIFIPKGRNNTHGYKSCWECLVCGSEIYTYTEFKELREKYI